MASFPTRRLSALLTPSYFPDATGSLQCNTGPSSPIVVSSVPPWHRSGAIWHLGLLLVNFPAEQITKAPESGNKVVVDLQLHHATPHWQHLPLPLWPKGVISSNRAQRRLLKQQNQTIPESRDDSRKQIPPGTPRSSSHPFMCHALLWQYSPQPKCTIRFPLLCLCAKLSPAGCKDSSTPPNHCDISHMTNP